MRVGARSNGSNDTRAQAAGKGEAAHLDPSIEDRRAVVEAPPWGISTPEARTRVEPTHACVGVSHWQRMKNA